MPDRTTRPEIVDLLVTGGTVITQNEQREIVPDAAIAVQGSTIYDMGPRSEIEKRYSATQVLDASGQFVFPGLINTHTHLLQTFTKGPGEGLSLYQWVEAVTAPAAESMTPRDAYLAAMLGGLESIHCGTTTLFDYQYPLHDEMYRGIAQALLDLGLRASLGMGMTETGEHHGLPAYLFYPVSKALDGWDALTAELKTRDKDDLLSFFLAPAIPFGITRAGLEQIRAYATERGMLISMHTNETADDNRASMADHGQRAVPFLGGIGFYGPDVLAVHCVQMEREDIEILSRFDVKISHNPISNMYLGSGPAPIIEMRNASLTIGLATDGAASNNTVDMIETMKMAGLTQKLVHRDPSVINAQEVLDMATIEGAKAIGVGGQLGSLELGKQADLFVLDPMYARSVPVFDPVATLVFSASAENVTATVVAGRVLMAGKQVNAVDEASLLEECQGAATDMARRAGIKGGHFVR